MIRLAFFCLCLLTAAGAARADDALWAVLAKGGNVVLIRHGLTTPGVGDPPGFTLADCASQRNLVDEGRAEARRVGVALKSRNIPIQEVRASPWCRCIETARLIFGTEPKVDTMLSNVFGDARNRDSQVAAFKRLVATKPAGNVMLVTHGSTTAAFTGINQGTAEMVVVTPDGKGGFTVAGRMPVPP